MGPVGFEPTTKGFTLPRRFRREWTISSPAHAVCVWVRDARACHQGHLRHHTALSLLGLCRVAVRALR